MNEEEQNLYDALDICYAESEKLDMPVDMLVRIITKKCNYFKLNGKEVGTVLKTVMQCFTNDPIKLERFKRLGTCFGRISFAASMRLDKIAKEKRI